MAKPHKKLVLESEVRLEYLKKLKKMQAERIIRIGGAGDFKKRYTLK